MLSSVFRCVLLWIGSRDAKSVSKMKDFKGDENAWPDWRYKFRVESSICFHQAAAILDWAGERYDQPISESDIQQVVATRENWADMANFNMQLHGVLVSLTEECSESIEIVLDACGRLNHKYDPRNH